MDSFYKRLADEIRNRLYLTFKYPLESAYRESPLEFLALLFSWGSLSLIIVLAVLYFLFAEFLKNSLLSSFFWPLILILVVIMYFGFIVLIYIRRKNESEPTSSHLITSQGTKNLKNIFIVHGHDSKIKEDVVAYLRSLNLNPIVLQEEPNLGKTIIEKVEYYIDQTSFAIVILTKDDFGVSKIDFDVKTRFSQQIDQINSTNLEFNVTETLYDDIQTDEITPFFELADISRTLLEKIQPRARQNVIFELGITMGMLHRNNVRVIYEENVELPTDILGYAYTSLDEKWKENLLKELKAVKIL